jgi:hypothetical protein
MAEYRLVVAGEFDAEARLLELIGELGLAVNIEESEHRWLAVAVDADFEIQLFELDSGDNKYKSRYDLPLTYEIIFSNNPDLVMQMVERWINEYVESFVLMADDQTIAMRRTRAIFFNMDAFIDFDDIFDRYIASDFGSYEG